MSDTMMDEPLELNAEEIPVVLHYVGQILENCEGWEPDSWVQEYVPALTALKDRIEANPSGPVSLSPEEGEGISMLAQDVVSFRAGPEGEDEEIFYRLLDKIEGEDSDEDEDED